jgi:hypothetical protein
MSRTFNELQDESAVQASLNTGGTSFSTVPAGVPAKRAPTTSDIAPQFTLGGNSVNSTVWMQDAVGQAGNWVALGTGASGGVVTLTGTSGGAISPSAGNINILGTANQIVFAGSGSTLTASFAGPYTPATYTAHGVLIGEGTSSIVATTPGTNGQILLGSTGADPAFGTPTTSTGIAYTTGAAALAIDVASGGYKVNAASAGVPLVKQNSYTVTQAGAASFALPAAAAVGDTFLIASALGNTAGWIITQGAGQEIWSGTLHTTNGATGTLAGAIHTTVTIMCTIANVEFIVIAGSPNGLTFT